MCRQHTENPIPPSSLEEVSFTEQDQPHALLLLQPPRRQGSASHWTEERALQAIRRYETYCLITGKHPSRSGYRDWQKKDLEAPSAGTVEKFGTWNEMRAKASEGSSSLRLRRRRWSRDECRQAVEEFEAFCKTNASPPILENYTIWAKERDVPSTVTIAKVFGSWNDARLAAAIAPEDVQLYIRYWSKRECMEAVSAFEIYCRQYNLKPTYDRYEEWEAHHPDFPSAQTVVNHWGSWKAARAAAEMRRSAPPGMPEFPEEIEAG